MLVFRNFTEVMLKAGCLKYPEQQITATVSHWNYYNYSHHSNTDFYYYISNTIQPQNSYPKNTIPCKWEKHIRSNYITLKQQDGLNSYTRAFFHSLKRATKKEPVLRGDCLSSDVALFLQLNSFQKQQGCAAHFSLMHRYSLLWVR